MGIQQQIAHRPTRLPPGTRVLVVEDQPFVALAVTDMVSALGGVVSAIASTVEEALTAVACADFTLALLDIDLDGRRSDPVAAAIAASGKPFLLTTGFIGRSIAGFETAPLLHKPYLQSQLASELIALLVAPRAPD
jgi:CheY-like chemotaxis protein